MKSFAQWLKENHNEEMPKGNIDANWFAERGLPMVVSCKCCHMRVALPNAFVDDMNYVYCSDCEGDD